MAIRPSTWMAAIVALVAAGSAYGQSAVRGVISTAGRPVASAQVRFDDGASNVAVTDSLGRFLVVAPSAGRHRLLVRALGFHPVARTMVLAPDDTLLLDVSLERNVQELAGVRVEENRPDPVLAPFEERRRAGFGRFFTRDMLAREEHSTLSNVLRRTAGIRLVRRPNDCGGGFAVGTGRTGLQGRPPSCLSGARFPDACYLNLFVDGLQYWVTGNPEPPNIDRFLVNGIEAIEVYRGPSETPIQYQRTGAACGVLLLWTRRSP